MSEIGPIILDLASVEQQGVSIQRFFTDSGGDDCLGIRHIGVWPNQISETVARVDANPFAIPADQNDQAFGDVLYLLASGVGFGISHESSKNITRTSKQ